MRLVVAGSGPLNYLVLIDAIELLPKLFEKVFGLGFERALPTLPVSPMLPQNAGAGSFRAARAADAT